MDMTMGSGKTQVLGAFIRRVIRLRNKFAQNTPLNILVLSDRINLVDQLTLDLVHGRDGKPGILT
jgi:type I site-specific restriction endonuclease